MEKENYKSTLISAKSPLYQNNNKKFRTRPWQFGEDQWQGKSRKLVSPAPPLVNRLFDRAAGLKFNIITKITVLYQCRVMVFVWLTRVYLSYWVHKSPPFLLWSPVHKWFLPGRSLDLITFFARGNRSLRWEEICGSSEKSRSWSGSYVEVCIFEAFLLLLFWILESAVIWMIWCSRSYLFSRFWDIFSFLGWFLKIFEISPEFADLFFFFRYLTKSIVGVASDRNRLQFLWDISHELFVLLWLSIELDTLEPAWSRFRNQSSALICLVLLVILLGKILVDFKTILLQKFFLLGV